MRRGLVLGRTPREWNVQVLTQEDFHFYCNQERICVQEVESRLRGLYVFCDDDPHIMINPRLRGAERVFVCFHELAHYWLHPQGIQHFHQMYSIAETEADVVAVCAMIPVTVLNHRWLDQIVKKYGYPPELVDLRLEVYNQWGI